MISVLQITIAVALVILILLQERSSGLSGLFGGEAAGGLYHTRRGMEKMIYWSTIILAIFFVAIALAQIAL